MNLKAVALIFAIIGSIPLFYAVKSSYSADRTFLKREVHKAFMFSENIGSSGKNIFFKNKLPENTPNADKLIQKNMILEQSNSKNIQNLTKSGNSIFSGGDTSHVDDLKLNFTPPNANSVSSSENNNSIIYISNSGNNQLISCNVNQTSYDPSSGNGTNYTGQVPTSMSNCKIINNLNLNSPQNLAVNNNMLYIINGPFGGQSFISSCSLDGNGNIKTCLNLNLPVANSSYITVNSSSQIIVSAFPTQGLSAMSSCAANSSGYVVICSTNAAINADLIPPITVNGYSYKYDIFKSTIYKCVGNSCQLITNPLIKRPLSLLVSRDIAYIGTQANTLVGCGVDQNSGNFFDCTTLVTGLNSPLGITKFDVNLQ